MGEVEEKQTLLPIYCRNIDHKDQLPMDKNAVVIEVKDNLKKLLMERPVPVDESRSSGRTIETSIYKIPKFVKDIQPQAYEPHMVSFGPYHHWDEHLVPMEQEKLKVFRHLVDVHRVDYESIARDVSDILEDLYEAYDNLDEMWRKEAAKFMEMMIIDACFMLVFLSEDESYRSLITLKSDIKRDILLLENQLPFQLLELLYEILPRTVQSKTLTSLIINNLSFIQKDELVIKGKGHILEMYRASLLYPPPIEDGENDENVENDENKTKKCLLSGDIWVHLPSFCKKKEKGENDEFKLIIKRQIIPQATLLHEAGIKFQTSGTKSLQDVSFKKGVLKLPSLIVDDDTETNLLNVMAFEKLHDAVGNQVTSFIVLMNNLIDIDKDVELLSNNDIIANALGNDEDAAKLFSVLGKGVAIDSESNITKVHRLVNKHCDESWNKWCANLKHSYFQNPWAIISFIAAIFGFAILIVQAVYQVVEFHTRK